MGCWIVAEDGVILPDVFSEKQHILPSIRISYSRVKGVKIERVENTSTRQTVHVYRPDTEVTHIYVAKYQPLHTAPTHL